MSLSHNVRGAMRLFQSIHRPPQVNSKRADRAALVLLRRDPDDLEAAAVDILADIAHWCDRTGIDWPGLVARATDHRNHEQPDDPRDAAPLAVIGPGGDYTRDIRAD